MIARIKKFFYCLAAMPLIIGILPIIAGIAIILPIVALVKPELIKINKKGEKTVRYKGGEINE